VLEILQALKDDNLFGGTGHLMTAALERSPHDPLATVSDWGLGAFMNVVELFLRFGLTDRLEGQDGAETVLMPYSPNATPLRALSSRIQAQQQQ